MQVAQSAIVLPQRSDRIIETAALDRLPRGCQSLCMIQGTVMVMSCTKSPPLIVHTLLPWYAEQFPVAVLCAAIGLVLGAMITWEIAPYNPLALSIAVGLFFFVIFSALGLHYRRSLLRRMFQRGMTKDPVDGGEIVFTPKLRHTVADLIPPRIVNHDKHAA